MIDVCNEKTDTGLGIAVLKNTKAGNLDVLRGQNQLFTVYLQGIRDGEVFQEGHIIRSIQTCLSCYDDFEEYLKLAECDTLRFIISNTTEVGIKFHQDDKLDDCPPEGFPSKLTQFLYHRFSFFADPSNYGLVIIPNELIDDNGIVLKDCIQKTAEHWKLPDAFIEWLNESCVFCSTLVDRIVTGFPSNNEEIFQHIGYSDQLLDVGEPYALWVIESAKDISDEFPLDKAGMPVLFTNDAKPYRDRKVKLLNGSHTASVLAASLIGISTVSEMMEQPLFLDYLRGILWNEIIPTIDLPRNELEEFATSVFERFRNPFLNHALSSIAVNSVAKWKIRLLPSLKAYYALEKRIPVGIAFSLAALLAYYGPNNEKYSPHEVNDIPEVMTFFSRIAAEENYIEQAMRNADLWGEDLTEYSGLLETVKSLYDRICNDGVAFAIETATREIVGETE